jgi:hypothetical protein
MHKRPGECAVKDDMEIIYKALKTADVLVMASPVYLDGMSARMKMVIDRCMCCMLPFLTKDHAGRVRHPYAWRMPAKFMLISTAGFPEMETFDPLIATFRAEAENFGSRVIAEICIPGTIALQVDPSRLGIHLGLLEETGRSIANTGEVDREVIGRLNTPPVDVGEYLELSKKYEAWCKKQLQ